MRFTMRFDIAAALIALVITGDMELTRLWFAIWHLR